MSFGAAARSCNNVRPVAFQNIAIVGSGAWGTALAMAAQRAGRRVVLWAREPAVVESIARVRRNPFLPNQKLPATIEATNNLEAALDSAELVLLVCPSQHLRAIAKRCAPLLVPDTPVVICSKGIEAGSALLMSEVVAEEMPECPQAVLSGPTFAEEVAKALPTAVTVAAPPDDKGTLGHVHHLAARVAVTLASATFRPYLSDDVIGVETGGAVKNVLAIACGIAAGRALGNNAIAAIITRGLAEMTRLTVALGGRADTVSGLAGAGDLILTCSSVQSRNFSYGKALGEGRRPQISENGPVVEGAVNAAAVGALARRLDVAMPICQSVEAVLRGHSIDEAMAALMVSDLRPEPLDVENVVRIPHPAASRNRKELLWA